MNESVWRSAELLASLLVAGGTAWLAIRTHKMAEVSSRQLKWLADQDEDARRPKVLFEKVSVPEKPEQSELKYVLDFRGRGLANLGSHAIVLEGLQIFSKAGKLVIGGNASKVVGPGASWPPADGGEPDIFAKWKLPYSMQPLIDSLSERADLLYLYIRTGADASQSWRVRFDRDRKSDDWLSFFAIGAFPEPTETVWSEIRQRLQLAPQG